MEPTPNNTLDDVYTVAHGTHPKAHNGTRLRERFSVGL